MTKYLVLISMVVIVFSSVTTAQNAPKNKSDKPVPSMKEAGPQARRPLLTFIELGSVNCIPCKAMQKVMKAVEEKYGDQIKIVFYDVWTSEQSRYAKEYNIRLIPTQVFLDESGKELMRHEGFFPEKDIDAFFQSRGLKPGSANGANR